MNFKLLALLLLALSFNVSAQSAWDSAASGFNAGSAMRSSWEARKERKAKEADEHYFSALETRVPDWKQVVATPEFVEWLKTRDQVSGKTYSELLTTSHKRRDADRVAEVFTAYGNARRADYRYFAALDVRVPEWEKINATRAFVEWLKTRDRASGNTYYDLLAAAHQERDVNRVVEIFAAYGVTVSKAGKINGSAQAGVVASAQESSWVELLRDQQVATQLDTRSQKIYGHTSTFDTRTVFTPPVRGGASTMISSSRESWWVDCKEHTNQLLATVEYSDGAWRDEVNKVIFKSPVISVPFNESDHMGRMLSSYCALPELRLSMRVNRSFGSKGQASAAELITH